MYDAPHLTTTHIAMNLNNVVYFVGREYAKEDTPQSLLNRAKPYQQRILWIENNREYIIDLLLREFSLFNHLEET